MLLTEVHVKCTKCGVQGLRGLIASRLGARCKIDDCLTCKALAVGEDWCLVCQSCGLCCNHIKAGVVRVGGREVHIHAGYS